MTYEAQEIRRLLERGTHEGEDFFRLKATGDGETRWMNVTPAQLDAVAAALDTESEPDPGEPPAPDDYRGPDGALGNDFPDRGW